MPNIVPFSWCYGIVTDVDPNNYLAKVNLQPIYDKTTGWIKIATNAIGNYEMPDKGQLVKVDFCMNDLDAGVITAVFYTEDAEHKEKANQKHTANEIFTQSKNSPPKWKIYRHPWSGTEVHIKDNGEFVAFTPEKIYIKAKKDVEIISETHVKITAPKATINSPDINLGQSALEALVKSSWVQNIFALHTHIGNLGSPTGTPVSIPATVPLTHFTQQVKGG